MFSIEVIIFLNIYCCVWAQTTNNEPPTQLSGNTEPLTTVHEETQTPKTGDNQTEYETTTQSSGNTKNIFLIKNIKTNEIILLEFNRFDIIYW